MHATFFIVPLAFEMLIIRISVAFMVVSFFFENANRKLESEVECYLYYRGIELRKTY